MNNMTHWLLIATAFLINNTCFQKALLFAFTQWAVTTAKDPLRPILKSAFVKTCLNLHYTADYETALGDVFSKRHSGHICWTCQCEPPSISTTCLWARMGLLLGIHMRQEVGTVGLRPHQAPAASGQRCPGAGDSVEVGHRH